MAVLAVGLAGCDRSADSGTTTGSDVTTTTSSNVSSSAPSPTTATSNVSSTAPPPTTSGTTPNVSLTTLGEAGRIAHPAGVTFLRPEGWHEAGATVSTAFVVDADCRAAVVVDREPPADSGQSPFVYQSVVQVCAQPNGGLTLDAYLAKTYGTGFPGFTATTVGGVDGYQSGEAPDWLIFVQTDRTRFQVLTSIVAEPNLEATRIEQVISILDSFDFS